MSVGIQIIDEATPGLEALAQSLSPQRLAAAVGPGCAKLTQQHLVKNGRNARGWPTTNFWARAAKATSWAPDEGGGVVVSINQIGVRQRYFGGPIRPVNAQALAIPISPLSYGHLPREFPGLFLLQTKKGAYLVQYGDGHSTGSVKAAKGQGGNYKERLKATLNFLFKLSQGVDQAPDPDVLPSDDEYGVTATRAIGEAVEGGLNG